MQSAATIEPEARAKADIYSFLATVFSSHPSEGSARVLEGIAALTGVPFPTGLPADGIEQEYMAMFVIPGPRYVAPYESVFRDRWLISGNLEPGSDARSEDIAAQGLLMGDSTLAVRRCFVDAGVLPENDLPDHLANELRLVAHLWRIESDPSAADRENVAALRREVRDEHLLKWVGDLRERLESRDELGYYAAAICVTESVLESDRAADRAP